MDCHHSHSISLLFQTTPNGHGGHTRHRQVGTHLHVRRTLFHFMDRAPTNTLNYPLEKNHYRSHPAPDCIKRMHRTDTSLRYRTPRWRLAGPCRQYNRRFTCHIDWVLYSSPYHLEEKIKERRLFSRTVGAMMKSLVIYCEDRGSTEIFQIFLQTLTSEENPAFYRTDRQA